MSEVNFSPAETLLSVGLDLDPNCLQRLSKRQQNSQLACKLNVGSEKKTTYFFDTQSMQYRDCVQTHLIF